MYLTLTYEISCGIDCMLTMSGPLWSTVNITCGIGHMCSISKAQMYLITVPIPHVVLTMLTKGTTLSAL